MLTNSNIFILDLNEDISNKLPYWLVSSLIEEMSLEFFKNVNNFNNSDNEAT